ncbi:Fact Complex Subunit Spt16 [Manis pentadactyla]|nr:Fact Complex Subunit Spt16 [Manis pentadactyla]
MRNRINDYCPSTAEGRKCSAIPRSEATPTREGPTVEAKVAGCFSIFRSHHSLSCLYHLLMRTSDPSIYLSPIP